MPLAAKAPPDPLVLIGRVVTFDDAQPLLEHGAVYIGADEHIHAVLPAKQPAVSIWYEDGAVWACRRGFEVQLSAMTGW
ncbi:MAG: hypothetical protein QOE28_2763 [Solirubrobacteraceae bacterium]|nr:hypothetical protein [Solirubrobacteraceae bacterium]